MKPIFNKTEKIEFAINFWNKDFHIKLVVSLLMFLTVFFVSLGFWFDLIRLIIVCHILIDSIKSYLEKCYWVDQLNNGKTDEFFDFNDLTDDDIKKG
ncbi:MAG: hypothetical protein ACK5OW_01505 [bacterium]|jgi:hypothetical protein